MQHKEAKAVLPAVSGDLRKHAFRTQTHPSYQVTAFQNIDSLSSAVDDKKKLYHMQWQPHSYVLHIFQVLIDTKVSPLYLRHYNDFILLHVLLQLHFSEYSIE